LIIFFSFLAVCPILLTLSLFECDEFTRTLY